MGREILEMKARLLRLKKKLNSGSLSFLDRQRLEIEAEDVEWWIKKKEKASERS